ncbi:putative nuclease HARBI1 [Saccostrea echinata]|uniref:putative nuclease HARBI1 n=1 Tax=Saccostrea echinata TaxID=191078 RepID=UPI002A80F20D|nr:putative nuclease HARBI1 [Saccostrea echinata]
MAAAYILAQNRRNLRRERVFRDRNNPLDYMTDADIIDKFRLPRHLILSLCVELNAHLAPDTRRSHALLPPLQIMVALRFYASGNFQTVTGDLHGISKASVSRVVNAVSSALVTLSSHYIKFPQDDRSINNTILGFSRIANFPNVIGAIDGTHIPVKAPKNDEHLFVNRKNFHSINVMAVCDSRTKFTSIVAKWPGSSHDAFVWTNSTLSDLFENGYIRRGWLLGDSAYPLKNYLMTPVLNPSNLRELAYNDAHAKTRNPIERSFGVLKMRFRCIDHSVGTLLFHPTKACRIVTACVVLHNLCTDHNVPVPQAQNPGAYQLNPPDIYVYQGPNNDGAEIRQRLILSRF